MSGTDLEKAKTILQGSDYTCVICSGEATLTSTERGVKPLLGYVRDGADTKGASAADRVVGRAAAFMYVLMEVKEVFSYVMSECAKDVFDRHGIRSEYDELVSRIENRTKDGLCPMESAVLDIEDPFEAKDRIISKLAELNKN